MSLTQSIPREPFPLRNLFRFGGGSVLGQHLVQSDASANVNSLSTLEGLNAYQHNGRTLLHVKFANGD